MTYITLQLPTARNVEVYKNIKFPWLKKITTVVVLFQHFPRSSIYRSTTLIDPGIASGFKM